MNRLIAIALASTLLTGCQSIFGHQAKLEVRPVGAEPSEATAAIALEEGRSHLMSGAAASAVVAFRIAALDPASAAPAHNGLGVAYAMLGRGDLAERYFRQAVAEDSEDPRFASNLAKFYQSREAALAKAEAARAPIVVAMAEEAPVAVAAERMMQAGPSVVRIDLPTPAGSMTRVSRQEVRIATRAPESPTGLADARRRNPRFSAAASTKPARAYPVRIELSAAARR